MLGGSVCQGRSSGPPPKSTQISDSEQSSSPLVHGIRVGSKAWICHTMPSLPVSLFHPLRGTRAEAIRLCRADGDVPKGMLGTCTPPISALADAPSVY